MKICIIGTGYVGLVSGVCLAVKGHTVTCVDARGEVVEKLNRAEPHIYEARLPDLLKSTTAEKRFSATLSLAGALEESSLVLIAVGTPSTKGEIDLTFVQRAAEQVGDYLRNKNRYVSVVIKSTVVPGTTDTLVRRILEQSSGRGLGEFGLGMNPEFLREGNAVKDFMEPDRIVLGYEDIGTLDRLQELYRPWNCEKLAVNSRTAEMIKYANNCLLATQISAVNELANLCFELGGIDVRDVMAGVHLDRRWNPELNGRRVSPEILTYLLPGCGFGGSCFPKDVQALRTLGRERGLRMPLLQAVLDVNDTQPLQVVRLLKSALDPLAGRKILVLGLAFKPDTDDVRESASLKIIRALAAEGCRVSAHDPIAVENARKNLTNINVSFISDWKEKVAEVDAIVVATKWDEYSQLTHSRLSTALKSKVVVDPRRMFRPEDFAQSIYLTIGRRDKEDAGQISVSRAR